MNKPRGNSISNKSILKAIRDNNGFITRAAKQLGCHYTTISKRMDKYPFFKKEVELILEGILDKCEYNIFNAVNEGDLDTTKWLLKYKGKKRGYIDKVEFSLVDLDKVSNKDNDYIAEHGEVPKHLLK